MPVESGLTLLRRVRALPPGEGGDVPAIAVTGFASRDDLRLAVAAGFQEHLPKPLHLDKLVETLVRLGAHKLVRSAEET